MKIPSWMTMLVLTTSLSTSVACDFDSELAPRIAADIVIDGDGVTRTETDLGYFVTLTRCRVAIDTLELTTNGELHASWLSPVWDLMVPTAYAHPGHAAGGEVVGELAGRFIFDWRDTGRVLGEATLLQARYDGANFSFARAQAEDGLPADDPIIGHTFEIAGTATIDEHSYDFTLLLDQDEGRRVVGLPLSLDVQAGDEVSLGLQLFVHDPFEDETLFDGVDFAALDDDEDGQIVIEPDTEAYNRLRRNFQVHDHYGITPQ